jgi:hypothetical protein
MKNDLLKKNPVPFERRAGESEYQHAALQPYCLATIPQISSQFYMIFPQASPSPGLLQLRQGRDGVDSATTGIGPDAPTRVS